MTLPAVTREQPDDSHRLSICHFYSSCPLLLLAQLTYWDCGSRGGRERVRERYVPSLLLLLPLVKCSRCGVPSASSGGRGEMFAVALFSVRLVSQLFAETVQILIGE